MSSKKINAYKNNWAVENRDRITLLVEKGKKEKLKAHAAEMGETLNSFINRAINETIERDEK